MLQASQVFESKKMRTVVPLFGLLAFANGQECGTDCPGGCCPLANMYCCENNWQCGFESDGSDCCTGSMNSPECPDVPSKVKQLQKMKTLAGLVNGQCWGTSCPAGCCPDQDMYCCENNWQCGLESDGSDCCSGSISDSPDCPDIPTEAKQLANMNRRMEKLDSKRSCPGGTLCPGGCCNEPNWFCCSDNIYCAATEADCPLL